MQHIYRGMMVIYNIGNGLQNFWTVKNGKIGCKCNILNSPISSILWNNQGSTFHFGNHVARIDTNSQFFIISPAFGTHDNQIYFLLRHMFPYGINHKTAVGNAKKSMWGIWKMYLYSRN